MQCHSSHELVNSSAQQVRHSVAQWPLLSAYCSPLGLCDSQENDNNDNSHHGDKVHSTDNVVVDCHPVSISLCSRLCMAWMCMQVNALTAPYSKWLLAAWLRYLPLVLIGLSISLVVKVPQIRDYAYSAYLEGMGLSHSDFGLLCSAGGLVTTCTYILSGFICDKINLRYLLLGCLALCAACLMLMALRPEMLVLVIAYSLLSFFGMSLFWCAALKAVCIIAKRNNKDNAQGGDSQGTAFGVVEGIRGGSGFFLAAVAVVLLSAFSQAELAISVVLTYFAVAHIVMAVLLYRYLPRDLSEDHEQVLAVEFKTQSALKMVLTNKVVWSIILVVAGIYTMFALMSYTGPFLEQVCGLPPALTALLSSLRVFVIALIAAPIGGMLSGYFHSSAKVITFGASMCGLLLVVLAFSNSAYDLWLVILLVMSLSWLVFALKGIQFAAIEQAKLPPQVTGLALGLICTVGYSPEAFVFSVVGTFLESFDTNTAYRLTFGLMAIGAFASMIGAICLWRLSKVSEQALDSEQSAVGDIFVVGNSLSISLMEKIGMSIGKHIGVISNGINKIALWWTGLLFNLYLAIALVFSGIVNVVKTIGRTICSMVLFFYCSQMRLVKEA